MILQIQEQFWIYFIFLLKIEQIKNKHGFKSDFNTWLYDASSWAKIYKEHDYLPKEIFNRKKHLKNLVTKAAALINLLDEPLLVEDDNMNSITSKLNQRELKQILEDYQEFWRDARSSLPDAKQGRPNESYHIRCVNLLIMMYKDGISAEPSCYRHDYKDGQYCGGFYDFMVDMLPVLQGYGVDLSKVQNETLARYAVELLPQRRKDKPYLNKLSLIDDSLLQE